MKLKKIVSLLLCTALLAVTLGACGKTAAPGNGTSGADTAPGSDASADSGGSGDAAQNEATQTELEHLEISVALWGIQEAFDNANAANDTIYHELCEKFNVTITPVGITWNDWKEKSKMWAAAGTLPDVFAEALATDDFGLYKTWAEQGIIKEIPSDLSAYPNLTKLFNMDSVEALAMDGKYYMVPRGNDLTMTTSEADYQSRGILYRKDWAAEAGYTEAPGTFEEMVEMAKAMMAQHPNAVGIAANSIHYLNTLALDIYPELVNPLAWVYENDQWIPSFASERTVPYIERLQMLYQEKVLDPDLLIQKDGDGSGRFMSGNACFMLGSTNLQAVDFMNANPDVTNLEDAVGYVLPFPAEDGNRYVFANTPYWSETFISAAVEDAKLERILMMLDYMYSHDFAGLVTNGIEGVDWERTDSGNASLLTDTTVGDKYPIGNCVGYLASWHGGFLQSADAVIDSDPNVAAFRRVTNEVLRNVNENCYAAPVNFSVMLMNNPEKNDTIPGLWSECQNVISRTMISTDNPREAWETMIKDFNARGLQAAIDSVTKQAADQGIRP